MKRILIILVILIALFPLKASAVTDYMEQIDQIKEEHNIDNSLLFDGNLESVIEYVYEKIQLTYKEPLLISSRIAAVTVMYAISKIIFEEKISSGIADSVAVLTVFISLLNPVKDILVFVSENLSTVKNFMISFIPVYSGIIMASGEFFTSTVFTGFFLTSMITISNICLNYVIPSLKFYLSVIISDALSPFIQLKAVGEMYIKAVKNFMKISVSLICFLLTLQTTISQGRDTLAVKTGKFVAGAAIPIVGSSLQDAIAGVYASMESIKGYAGVIGLSGVVMVFIPSIISLVVYWLYTSALYILTELLDVQSISKCIKGFIEIIELVLSVITVYMVMFIFSITIMIAVTNGV